MKATLKVMATVLFALALAILMHPAARAETAARPDIVEVVEFDSYIDTGSAREIAAKVEKINESRNVKAVVLVVNSPGGGASASAVIYQELSKLKVPVVGFCEYVCASGGMYMLMPPSVKYIVVRDDTIAGSIGVISQITRFNRLLEWAKIDNETYKSGSLKDAGNPTRAAQDVEKAYIQSIIDELAQKFYGVVKKGRPALTEAQMQEIITAKIFIGAKAVKVGLADAVGTRESAVKKAKELSGSKIVFTREELRKMSKAADEHTEYALPKRVAPESQFGDIAWLIETLKEIRAGESVRIEYRLPYRL